MDTVEILDVGHGNCSLVSSDGDHVVIDAPLRNPLVDLLRKRGITQIGAIVISHADADHLAGVEALLYDEQIAVGRLYVNPEQRRPSGVWDTFKVAAAAAGKNGTKILPVTRDSAEQIPVSSAVSLAVMSPTGAEILAGADGKIGKTKYSANRLSVVIRVLHNSVGRVLLPADMDAAALEDILDANFDISSDVLVFPHHGGHSNGDPSRFSTRLLEAVQPELVVFSLGHSYSNPMPENIGPVLASDRRVCCTGLARPCEPGAPGASSCAGSVTIDLATGSWAADEDERHRKFVDEEVTQPLCRRFPDL